MATQKLDLVEGGALTVADIMVAPVRTVAPDLSLAALVRVFLSEQITGAPVVDEAGRLLGVVSTSDVIRAVAGDEEISAGDTFRDSGEETVPAGFPGEDPQETLLGYFEAPGPPPAPAGAAGGSVLGDLTVRDVMTPATFAVAPDATVRELAGFLTRGRIHRSLVVEGGVLQGIVTSSDIVRLIAADEEPTGSGGRTP